MGASVDGDFVVVSRLDGSLIERGSWGVVVRAAIVRHCDGQSVSVVDAASGDVVVTNAGIAEWMRWDGLGRAGWVRS